MVIPKYQPDLGYEDTSNISDDVSQLFVKYIKPIEDLRSFGVPSNITRLLATGATFDNPSNLKVGVTTSKRVPFESRLHAFYRMIGLPVVSSDGDMYSPGFSPPGERGDDNRISIAAKVSQENRELLDKREEQVNTMRDILLSKDMRSTICSAVTLIPKPFNTIDNKNQAIKIDGREEFFNKLLSNNEGSESVYSQISKASGKLASTFITSKVNNIKHIITPFMVDPIIDFTVLPSKNIICVPFLPDVTSTKSDANQQSHHRPGIEFILRMRLSDRAKDKLFMDYTRKVLARENSPGVQHVDSLNESVLNSTIEALAEKNDFKSADIDKLFGQFSATQSSVITQLIGTIKVVIGVLINSILEFHEIMNNINWLPAPSAAFATTFGTPGKVIATSRKTALESKIFFLTILKENSKSSKTIEQELGVFASPFIDVAGSSDVYDSRLKDLVPIKEGYETRSMELLQTIEVITGEFSGLGLIDILAIYTALWSISMEDLLNLIDDDAVTRIITYNPSLISLDVLARRARSPDTLTALSNLESKVKNILSFADLLVQSQLSNPTEEQGNPT